MMSSNIYENDQQGQYDNAENGIATEELFAKSANAAGWMWRKAPPQLDYSAHIDCTIEWVGQDDLTLGAIITDGAIFAVDVKSNSREDLVWIELRNIDGKGGWLYGGADLIAFARESGFLMVDRVTLKDWIEENVEKTYVTNKRDALMKVYTREGRKDMITRVQNYHLIGLADGKIPYA